MRRNYVFGPESDNKPQVHLDTDSNGNCEDSNFKIWIREMLNDVFSKYSCDERTIQLI